MLESVTKTNPVQMHKNKEQETHIQCAIGLGSNKGERENILKKALKALNEHPHMSLMRTSTFIETPPWGPIKQDPYINACCLIETHLLPHDLLDECLKIERRFGRDRALEQRWGPRTLDLDILLYGNKTIQTQSLTIPHPRMFERDFVMRPLKEIMPNIEKIDINS